MRGFIGIRQVLLVIWPRTRIGFVRKGSQRQDLDSFEKGGYRFHGHIVWSI